MLDLSDDAKAALAAGTAAYRPRVALYQAGAPLAGMQDVPLDEGNPGAVTVDETASVVRSGTLNFAASDDLDEALPARPLVPLVGGPLQPSGTEAWVYMDLHLPDGAVWPLLLAKLQLRRVEADDAPTPVVTAAGLDYAQKFIDAQLDGPYDIPAGDNGATALHALLDAGVPGMTYSGFDAISTPYLSTGWHLADGDDRWARGGEIAKALGKRLRIANDGTVQLLDVVDPSAAPPAWTYDESEATLLTGVKHALDRAGAASHAIVVGQPSGDNPPVRSEAFDLDPASTTYYPTFGDAQVRLTSGFVGGQAQAAAASAALLAGNRGLVEYVELTALPVHALEDGDVVHAVKADLGVDAFYVLSRFPLPLSAAPQVLTTRSRRVA